MTTREQIPMKPAAAAAPPHFTPAPFGTLQRKCACGGSAGSAGGSGESGGDCAECKKKKMTLQRRAIDDTAPTTVPPIVYDVLRSPGQSLDPKTRTFMEPRFGHDFSRVRIHSDAPAAESARAVNALAYTVGPNVVFGAGQYQPATLGGKQLLAHELTHVIQQQGQAPTAQELRVGPCDDAFERAANQASLNLMPGGKIAAPRMASSAPASVQRACGPAAIGKPAGCALLQGDVVGEHYLFTVNCDDFKAGEEARLQAFAATMTRGGSAKIHGFASIEGDPKFNESLSCARAIKGQSVVNDVLVAAGKHVSFELFAHGATAGDRDDRRSITIDWLPAGPEPTPPTPTPPPPKPAPIKGTPVVIGPTANSIICKGGGLVVQNNNTGPDKDCTQTHEGSHIQDWKNRYGDDLCKGVADGSLPVGGPGYDEFLRTSECGAYTTGKQCRENLLKTAPAADRASIQSGIDRDNAQLKSHKCS
jgi:Domain of unknown function (DUF4157)